MRLSVMDSPALRAKEAPGGANRSQYGIGVSFGASRETDSE
jgi:hypothetical protein